MGAPPVASDGGARAECAFTITSIIYMIRFGLAPGCLVFPH